MLHVKHEQPRLFVSAAQGAQLFGISRQAFMKWLKAGPPAGRAEAVAPLAAATDLLEHHLKRERIAALVRRKAPQLSGQSLLGLAAAGEYLKVRSAVESMFDLRRIQVRIKTVTLPKGRVWLRVASSAWKNPLDPSFAQRPGGRWNPPGEYPTLYLNADLATARNQLERMLEGCPAGLDDLDDTAFLLVAVRLENPLDLFAHRLTLGIKADLRVCPEPDFSPDSSAMPSQRRRRRRASPVAGDDWGNRGRVLETMGSIHRVRAPAYPPRPHRPHSPRSSSETPTHRSPLS
jgi:hypothetical protein